MDRPGSHRVSSCLGNQEKQPLPNPGLDKPLTKATNGYVIAEWFLFGRHDRS